MTCSSCPSASPSAPVVAPLVGSVLPPEDIVKIFFAAFKLTLPLDILTAISFSVVELVSVFVILNESVEEFVAFLKAQGFSDIKLDVTADVTTVTTTKEGLRADLGKSDEIPVLPDIVLTPENLPGIFFELFKLSLPVNVSKNLLGSAVEFAVVFLTQNNEVDNLKVFLKENEFRVPEKGFAPAAATSGSDSTPVVSSSGALSVSSIACKDTCGKGCNPRKGTEIKTGGCPQFNQTECSNRYFELGRIYGTYYDATCVYHTGQNPYYYYTQQCEWNGSYCTKGCFNCYN